MMISRFDYFRGEGCEPEEALELALGDASEASGALGRQVMDIRAGNPGQLEGFLRLAALAPEVIEAAYHHHDVGLRGILGSRRWLPFWPIMTAMSSGGLSRRRPISTPWR